jgi:pSer/pThr/pTyr-binding forkhead associated (FHA) protein
MTVCPNCHHKEIPGALFCSECGARLVAAETPTTQFIDRSTTASLSFQKSHVPPIQVVPPTAPSEASVSLHLIDSGQIVNLLGQNEFSIGRVTDGQPILPDVDLSVYEAYSQGVSRLHASLKVSNSRVYITDLGSSNGTRVNGQKIMSHVDYPLNHGDVIALGKFKIQVLVRKSTS